MASCERQCQGSLLYLWRYRDWTVVNINTVLFGSRNRQSNWVKKATYDHISWAKNKSWPKVFTLSPKNGCKSQMPVFVSYTDALLSLCCYKSIQNADYSKGMAFHSSLESAISVLPVGCLLFKLEDIEESIALVRGLHSYSNPGIMLGCCCSKDNDKREQSLWLFTSICHCLFSYVPAINLENSNQSVYDLSCVFCISWYPSIPYLLVG